MSTGKLVRVFMERLKGIIGKKVSKRQNDRICTQGIPIWHEFYLAMLKVFQSSESIAFIQAKGSGFGARAMLKDAIAA